MTNMITYSGLRTDLHNDPYLLEKIRFTLANSPINEDVEYGKVYEEELDEDEEDDEWGQPNYWGVKHLPSGREMAIFYDDEAHVFADSPAWRILVNEILDIMDAYSISKGYGPVRRDENF